MADNLVKVLEQLVRDRKALQAKEQRHAQRERQMIDSLRQLLPRMGYRLVAAIGGHPRFAATAPGTQKPKRLRCPKCDRRFAHPLPMARHLKATHGISATARVRKRGGKGKAKLKKPV
jgi:uncharacterized C2H2 Zn-finger protein